MLNEGPVVPGSEAALRSEMVRRIKELGEATADQWERAVFESILGHSREDVDWDVEDNKAGYYTWLKSFDRFAGELVEDGFVRTADRDGKAVFQAAETDPAIDWSPMGGTQG